MNRTFRIEYNLQFFAKEGPGGEKTEEATGRKLDKARSEGQVAKSQDLNVAVLLLVLFISLKVFGGFMYNRFTEVFTQSFRWISDYSTSEFTVERAVSLLSYGLKEIVIISLPVFGLGMIAAFVINYVQVKWKPTAKPLKPTFSKLNPINGFKRMFGASKVMELLKTIVKLVVLFYVIYSALQDEWGLIINVYQLELTQAVIIIANTVIDVAIKISAVFFAIAVFDYMYQKRKFKKEMRMTKQEVKEEFKNTEGNPQIKGQIRRKMQEASRRRMMQALPEADVVITNPTHLAVAIICLLINFI